MTLKALLLLLASAISASGSMALFRHALYGNLKWEGSLLVLFRDIFLMLGKPSFLIGGLAFALSIVLWFLVLATQKLSIAYPVQIGLVIVFSGILSVLLFSEVIHPRGYVGYALILAGVFLVSN
ncbi:MAG: hypothetical protein AAGA96_08605 [Verrucomicrobiota bacterium]